MSDAVSSLPRATPVPARRGLPALGWVSCILAVAATAVMVLGLSVAQASDGEGALNQIWRGVIFAVASCAMAGVGLGAAAVGLLRSRGRYAAIAGIFLNAAFWALFWILWVLK